MKQVYQLFSVALIRYPDKKHVREEKVYLASWTVSH